MACVLENEMEETAHDWKEALPTAGTTSQDIKKLSSNPKVHMSQPLFCCSDETTIPECIFHASSSC